MKLRIFALLLAGILCFTGCAVQNAPETSTAAPAPRDLPAVYQQMSGLLPEMTVLDETMQLNLCGISTEDCLQAVVAVCSDGLRVDEIWLLEAKDEAALSKLEKLAQSRLANLAEQTQSYSPEQYAVVQKAKLFRSGNYLVLLTVPNVEELEAIWNGSAA